MSSDVPETLCGIAWDTVDGVHTAVVRIVGVVKETTHRYYVDAPLPAATTRLEALGSSIWVDKSSIGKSTFLTLDAALQGCIDERKRILADLEVQREKATAQMQWASHKLGDAAALAARDALREIQATDPQLNGKAADAAAQAGKDNHE